MYTVAKLRICLLPDRLQVSRELTEGVFDVRVAEIHRPSVCQAPYAAEEAGDSVRIRGPVVVKDVQGAK